MHQMNLQQNRDKLLDREQADSCGMGREGVDGLSKKRNRERDS